MEEDFATMKLVTGEEIISKVSYMPDDDSLVLENPMEVTSIDQQEKYEGQWICANRMDSFNF